VLAATPGSWSASAAVAVLGSLASAPVASSAAVASAASVEAGAIGRTNISGTASERTSLPHSGQNFALTGIRPPHAPQVRTCSRTPHSRQNLALGGLSVAQFAQTIDASSSRYPKSTV
jgi:hypothetical protein